MQWAGKKPTESDLKLTQCSVDEKKNLSIDAKGKVTDGSTGQPVAAVENQNPQPSGTSSVSGGGGGAPVPSGDPNPNPGPDPGQGGSSSINYINSPAPLGQSPPPGHDGEESTAAANLRCASGKAKGLLFQNRLRRRKVKRSSNVRGGHFRRLVEYWWRR